MNEVEKALQERFLLQKEYLGDNKPVNQIIPLVSVTVATYQHVNYIKECLDGILMQKTDFSYEIILGEDGSIDGTQEICKEYAEKFPDRIRLFIRDRNLSQYKGSDGKITRFNGIWNRMSSRGKYIAWCEGDDYWIDSLKLQKQVDFLESRPEYGLCYAKARSYDQRTGKFKRVIGSYCAGFVEFLEGKASIPALTVMYRAEYLKGYYDFVDGKRWMMGDAPLWLYIAYNSKIYFFDEVVAVYRVLENSATGRNSYQKHKEFIKSSYNMRLFFANKSGYNNTGYLKSRYFDALFTAALSYNCKKDIFMYFKKIHHKTWKVYIKYLLYLLGLFPLR